MLRFRAEAIDHDEDGQDEQGAEVLANEVFGSTYGSGEDREDRLLFELAIQRGAGEHDGDRDRVDRDGGGTEVGDNAWG